MEPKTNRFYLNPTPQQFALNFPNGSMSQRAFRNIAHSSTRSYNAKLQNRQSNAVQSIITIQDPCQSPHGSSADQPIADQEKAMAARPENADMPVDQDTDPQETQEWQDALTGVIEHE